jgi:hypothetical protein
VITADPFPLASTSLRAHPNAAPDNDEIRSEGYSALLWILAVASDELPRFETCPLLASEDCEYDCDCTATCVKF